MRKVRIGTSTPKKQKLSSRAIRWIEGTEFSHFFIVMEGRGSLPFDKVAQASYGDVHFIHYDNFKKDNTIFYEKTFTIPDEDYYKAATWLWEQLQKPYSFTHLLGIFFDRSIGSIGDDSYICTELVARFLHKSIGLDISQTVDYLGLKDLDKIIKEL